MLFTGFLSCASYRLTGSMEFGGLFYSVKEVMYSSELPFT